MRPLRRLEEAVRRRLDRSRRNLEGGETGSVAAPPAVVVRGTVPPVPPVSTVPPAPAAPSREMLAARTRAEEASADFLPNDPGIPPLRPQNPWLVGGGIFTGLAAVVAAYLLLYAVWPSQTAPTLSLAHAASGDPARGRAVYAAYGCSSCHITDPLSIRRGEVGPRLDRFANRGLIAGALPNTEANLIRYLVNPQQEVPRTAMPNLNVTGEDARDIAAYLYTLGASPQ